jgi:hypothetical protein
LLLVSSVLLLWLYMSGIVADNWVLTYDLTNVGFGESLKVDPVMQKEIEMQLNVDYNLYYGKCPEDDSTSGWVSQTCKRILPISLSRYPGYMDVELYAYARDLTKYTDLAVVAESLGYREIVASLTNQVCVYLCNENIYTFLQIIFCMKPFFERQTRPPVPCEPPAPGFATCVRNEMGLWYDAKVSRHLFVYL